MSLPEALESTFLAMPWLTSADGAAMDLARAYAERIDEGVAEGGERATKALYLGPHLLKTLGDLGATPAGRKVLEVKAGGVVDELEQIRARRPGRA